MNDAGHRWTWLVHWLAVVAVVAASVGAVVWAHSIRPDARYAIERAELLRSGSSAIPPARAPGWTAVSLPVDRSTGGGDGRAAWIRLRVADVEPREPLALYFPMLRTNAVAYWNGEAVGRVGEPGGATARNWQVPAFWMVPGRLVLAGENVVHVRVEALPGKVALSRAWVGPDEDLRRAYRARMTLKLAAIRVMGGGILLLAAVMAVIWVRRPSDAIYGVFALMLLALAAYSLLFGFETLPVSQRSWVLARVVALGWFIAAVVVAVHRFFDLRRPRTERGIVAFTAGATVVSAGLVVASPAAFDLFAARGFPTASLGIGLYPAAAGFLILRRQRDLPALLLLASGFALIVFGTHDVLMVNHLWSASGGYWVHYGTPLVAGAFGWTLLTRFVDALSESETLNRELELRVAAKGAELERNYERLREAERERVLAAERERLMGDIHDGVGGQLVSSLALLESGRAEPEELTESLRAALEDLRLVIDSMEPTEGDATAVLAMVRHRLGRHVERSGVALEWRVTDLPAIPGLGPGEAIHLARIVQEALTNALKHARARRIAVRTASGSDADGSWVEVVVEDDGAGIPAERLRGRGLASMERRAAALGGRLGIESSAAGTTIRLRLPLRPSSD